MGEPERNLILYDLGDSVTTYKTILNQHILNNIQNNTESTHTYVVQQQCANYVTGKRE